MARVISTHPRFHDVVTLPIRGRPEGLRVVVTDDGVLISLVRWFSLGRNERRSLAWQTKAARAVGLLYDYLRAVPAPDGAAGQREHLSRFVGHLMAGTVRHDGSDPTGLGWRRMPWGQVKEVLRYINEFSDYCTDEADVPRLNPEVAATFAERVAAFRALDARNSHSLLKHLGNARAAYEKATKSRLVTAPDAPMVRREASVAFPPEHFRDLLLEGFRVPGSSPEDPPWVRHNLRDVLIALLQRHGGCRASEPLHIYTRDIVRDPTNPHAAHVRLYHPELGRYTTLNPVTGRIEHVTRAEYLMIAYNRIPRNRMTTKERAGWKNLMLDAGPRHGNYAIVRWFPTVAGEWFWEFLQMYVRNVLGALPPERLKGHPYLFVNLDGENLGAPYRLGAYHQNLEAAVRRIGLTYGKDYGTTSHGLRHRYAQDLKAAGVPNSVIKVCLHHKSLAAQETYTAPDNHTVHAELNRGWQRLHDSGGAPRTLLSVAAVATTLTP